MEISGEELKTKIENGDKMIIDFWASWCGPCKMMKPMFESASKNLMESSSQVQLYTLNVEENRDIIRELGIVSIPTLKGYSNGKEIFTEVGVKNTPTIVEMTKRLI